ncbi:MAG TPA: hypothetical protein V6C97_27505, partial [Oculatellaceae cyanobacterium]
ITDMDGNAQSAMPLDFVTVEPDRKTKEQICMRIGWLVGLIKSGNADFDRYLIDKVLIDKIADTKNHKYQLVEGSLYSVKIAQYFRRWAEGWDGQRWEYEQEIERLRVQLQEYD